MCDKSAFFGLYVARFGPFPADDLKTEAVRVEWQDFIDSVPERLLRPLFDRMADTWTALNAKPRLSPLRKALSHVRACYMTEEDRRRADMSGDGIKHYEAIALTPLFDFGKDGFPRRREVLQCDLPRKNARYIKEQWMRLADRKIDAQEFKTATAACWRPEWYDYEDDEKTMLCRKWNVKRPVEEEVPF